MSQKKLHALLIGINNYHPKSGVTPLYGCQNDVEAFTKFLHQCFDKTHIKTLLNEQATYRNIIDGFEEVTSNIDAEDTFIFLYSGHGTQEKAAEEFETFFAEGMNESMVCYDSLVEGGQLLADKELAVLLERIAHKEAKVVTIFDCCHSGGITRDISHLNPLLSSKKEIDLNAKYQVNIDKPRALETYLDGHYSKQLKKEGKITIPASKHIALSACSRKEKAYEMRIERGLFLKKMLDVLEVNAGGISYANLYTQTKGAVNQVTTKQNPTFYPYNQFDAHENFLGLGEGSQRQRVSVNYDAKKETWKVMYGAIHGVPTDAEQDFTFALFEGEEKIGEYIATSIQLDHSIIDFEGDKNKMNYFAEILSIPMEALTIQLVFASKEGEKRYSKNTEFIRPIRFKFSEAISVEYQFVVDDDEVQILYADNKEALRTIKGDDDELVFKDAIAFLENISSWHSVKNLRNEKGALGKNIEVHYIQDGKDIEVFNEDEIELVVELDKDHQTKEYEPVEFEIKLKNNFSNYNLQTTAFLMTQEYGVHTLDGAVNTALPKRSQISILADEFYLEPEETEYVNNFKFIFCTDEVFVAPYILDDLVIGETKTYNRKRKTKSSVLIEDGKGGLGSRRAKKTGQHIWFTKTMTVKVVGKVNAIKKEESSGVGDFIVVHSHPEFEAELSLTTASANTKSIDYDPIDIVAQTFLGSDMELLSLNRGTKDIRTVNTLSLGNVKNSESLKENPLKITVNADLKEGEMLLPLTFDGEHFIPFLAGDRKPDGSVDVEINHIPELKNQRTRGFLKALGMCFLKLALGRNTQTLQWIDYSGHKPRYKSAGLPTQIENANNILLVVHGIIGNTEGMAVYAKNVFKASKDSAEPFDLVLAYDYENLNTEIQKTAEILQEKLFNAGINPERGKKITILAHSMGGLVARYFIETMQGKEVVKKLVMAGTPNAGSAIARITTYRDYATYLISFLVNYFGTFAYAATILAVLKGSKKLTKTLAQMDYDKNPFLPKLEANPDPNIPYHIVAGNLIEYYKDDENYQKLLDKIIKAGGNLFYKDEPNDVAVAVSSIKNVSTKRTPTPHFSDVDCHHCNYFVEPIVVKKLNEILRD